MGVDYATFIVCAGVLIVMKPTPTPNRKTGASIFEDARDDVRVMWSYWTFGTPAAPIIGVANNWWEVFLFPKISSRLVLLGIVIEESMMQRGVARTPRSRTFRRLVRLAWCRCDRHRRRRRAEGPRRCADLLRRGGVDHVGTRSLRTYVATHQRARSRACHLSSNCGARSSDSPMRRLPFFA
jgi:hypothetical protein